MAAAGLYHPSMNSKIALRASPGVLKLRRFNSSHSSVARKLSHIALSKQSPTEPIEGRTRAFSQRWPKASEGVLAALIGVVNDANGPPLLQRHVEGL